MREKADKALLKLRTTLGKKMMSKEWEDKPDLTKGDTQTANGIWTDVPHHTINQGNGKENTMKWHNLLEWNTDNTKS